jgi:glycerate 2-kinase
MKIVLIPDKFKGTLTAQEVCDAMENGIKRAISNTEIVKIPMADGGEGSLDVLQQNIGGEWVELECFNPIFEIIKCKYLVQNNSAYIEMAQASGLQLIQKKDQNPLLTSSYGTGQLLIHALNSGIKDIYLLVGGSATNDAGLGMAIALGYKFYDKNKIELQGIGKNLINIRYMDFPSNISQFKDIKIRILTDVQNPLTGPQGASQVFAKQKGATIKAIDSLEKGMLWFVEFLKINYKIDIDKTLGAGAAGGIAAGATFFLNAEIAPGLETIFRICKVEEHCKNADLILSGEGKLDLQTLQGKLILGISRYASKSQIPFAVICGCNELTPSQAKKIRIKYLESLINDTTSLKKSITNAAKLVSDRTFSLLSSIQ